MASTRRGASTSISKSATGNEPGPRVFISYRRRDAFALAGRLADRLADEFQVVMDFDSIRPGDDFSKMLRQAVASSDVVLALVGRQWAIQADEEGQQLLDESSDWVVAELTIALRMGVPVIPVLVDGADLVSQLPTSLGDLGNRQAAHLGMESFAEDVDRLSAAIRSVLADESAASVVSSPPSEIAPSSTIDEQTPSTTEAPAAQTVAPGQSAAPPSHLDFDEGAVLLISWAQAVRHAQGYTAGERTDLILGALAAARATIDHSGEAYDPAAWALVQSLATTSRPLPTILDEALNGLALPDEPDDTDQTMLGTSLFDVASAIAEETGGSPQIQQRHILAATLMVGELPEAVTTTLGADRTDLGGRLLEAITRLFPDENAAAWDRILGPGDLESTFASDMVPARRSRSGAAPPPLVDQLGMNTYVSMLATMIARRTTAMPVSIGLFGEWGSGKSYFMGLLRDRVDELRKRQPGEPPGPYHEEIVQITFNAWSYADTNLWASLAADFFTQLGDENIDDNEIRRAKITETLKEKNQFRKELTDIKEAAERRTGEVRSAYVKAVADRESRTRRLNATLVKAVITDPGLHDELGRLSNRLGFSKAHRDKTLRIAEDVRGIGDDLLATRRVLAQRSLVLPFLLLLVAVITVGVAMVAPTGWWSWLTDSSAVTGVVAFVTSVGVAVGNSRSIVGRLRTIAGRAQELQQTMISDQANPEVGRLSQRIHDAEAQEAAAQAQLIELDAAIAALDRQLLELEPGRRLYEFIAERAASTDYRSQLGVVSMVRHDFQELVDLMSEWARQVKAVPHTSPRPIDRIVLYIDDLDRCEPDQVVQVLQAVHLLLAMDLFVVVVGVDPRWLLRSLQTRYRGVIESGSADIGNQLNFAESTPQNYLEKIFQIPFVLPGMTDTGFGDLMGSLASAGRPTDAMVTNPASETAGNADSTTGESPSRVEEVLANGSVTSSHLSNETPPPVEETDSEVSNVNLALNNASDKTLSQVTATPVTRRELDLLRDLSPLVRTPRAATRLFNIYGLLRSLRNLTPGRQFLGSSSHPGDYQAVIQLLGVLSGAPQLLGVMLWGRRSAEDDLLHVGLCGSNDPGSWATFVAALLPEPDPIGATWANNVAAKIAKDEVEEWQDLVERLQQVRAHTKLDDLAPYREWGPQVARFSFLLSPFAQAEKRLAAPSNAIQ